MRKIASFDVFDTVLTRAVGSPEAVFLLLGRSLMQQALIPCSAEAFARVRIDAERRAFQNRGPSCTIDAIHRELAISLRLTEKQSQILIQQEFDIEAKLIRAVPGAVDRLQQKRVGGYQIVFLSDMYLPMDFIRQQLIHHGLWEVGDRCLVSCELGKSKLSGTLFEELLSSEEVQPQSVVHQGNSDEGDSIPASRSGLCVNPFTDANLNRYEEILSAYVWRTEGLASAMAGASRLARLKTPAMNSREMGLINVATGVMAPTLVGYVLWVLHRAKQLGLNRLYFVSRDGQILLSIARKLARVMDITCDLRYLYGSRQSWNLPAVIKGSDEELSWIWDHPDLLSVENLLRRVDLHPQQLQEQLLAAGFSENDWSRPLRSEELQMVKQSLMTQPVRSLIMQQAQKRRQKFIKYLRKEKVFDEGPWGLVDLGWYGSMQNAISSVLLNSGETLPVGFYFALFKGVIVNKYASYRETYYFDEHQNLGFINTVPDIIALMEMFCAADHGTVIDFIEQDGQVKPMLTETRNNKVVDWGLSLIHEAVFNFLDNLILDAELINPLSDIREAITDLMEAFWLHPSRIEAEAWADFPWEDGIGSEVYWSPLAKSYDWKDILQSIFQAKVAPHHRGSWFQGSLLLSPLPIRIGLIGLARLFRLYRSLRFRANVRLRSLMR